MSNRDWEKELAEIDKRLASVPDAPPERAAPGPPAPAGRPAAAPPAPTPQRRLGTPADAPGRRSWRTQLALLLRIAFGAAVVAALIYWPYPSRCGVGLGYYLALVAVLALAGVATSVAAWRHRSPFVHVLGLVMLGASGVLGAREVLPKVGYAYPTPTHPVAWACE
jgi:hypothetical protein